MSERRLGTNNNDAAAQSPAWANGAEVDVRAYRRDQYGTNGVKRAQGRAGHGGVTAPSRQSGAVAGGKHAVPQSAGEAGVGATSGEAQPPYKQPSSSEVYHEIARERKRSRKRKRILVVVCAVILTLVAAGGAYALWFTSSLDSALAPDSEKAGNLNEVLVPSVSGKPFYMLLLGSDSREGNNSKAEDEQGSNERSDVMILARVDIEGRKITLLSIPRDTPHKREDGTYEKINEVYNREGASGTVRAVSELTGVDISHYAEVHISGLQAVVDLLGGVTVDVPIKLEYFTTEHDYVILEPGKQTLNGEQAEVFARARHGYETDQDAHRQTAVRQLLMAIMEKTLKRPVTEIPGIVLEEAKYVDTDMKSGDVVSLAMGLSNGSGKFEMYTGTGPHDGDVNPDAGGLWMCYENPEGWRKVMEVVDSGGDPHGMDFSETAIPWRTSSENSEGSSDAGEGE